MLNCTYGKTCSGCDWLDIPLADQQLRKSADLRSVLGQLMPPDQTIEYVGLGEGGLRDRVDLMLDRREGGQRLGLFGREKSGIVDLDSCPQLSASLEQWLKDFRQLRFPIERGSLRLRVAPDGRRGVWLDFANVDVKALLDEGAVLNQLLEMATVEVGQRRKRLVVRDGKLKLGDPVLEAWFETHLGPRRVPLYCTIGSFTQPGFEANRRLVAEAMKLVSEVKPKHVIEFGSGVGNFTLPLAQISEQVDAYELDALALMGLELSLAQQAECVDRVRLHRGDYQRQRAKEIDFAHADLVFVDPPRSGLMGFLESLAGASVRPSAIVYVSCFSESFSQDAHVLQTLGYALDAVRIVDQFPQSRHYEIVSRFRLV